MRKKWLVTIFSSLFVMAGCQADTGGDNEEALYRENGNTINVNERNDLYNVENMRNGGGTSTFGYVRHQKNAIGDNTNVYQQIATFDRERAADSISRLAVSLPNINDAATLVTDEEVLIAYRTDAANRNAAADQVKRTAMSVVPRYYHVYVSDNPQHIRDVENFSMVGSTTPNMERSIENTIREMLKSPQGQKMSDGENENGEMKNELNDGMDEDIRDHSTLKHPNRD